MPDEPTSAGTSSTPSAVTPAADPSATSAAPAQPAEPVTAAAPPAKAADPAPAEAPKPAEPAKAEPTEPLFTLPDDFKPPETMVAKFQDAIKGKVKDGNLTLKPQEVADLYVDLARDANASWQKQIEKLNTDNEAACKARFSSEELAAAESAVGFFSSNEPAFRDFAKRQLNDPTFVNAMRLIGELLEEDGVGRPEKPAPVADKRPLQQRAAEKLYGKPAH